MLIILVTLDCVRADHVGGKLTPYLNALSPEWTTFNQAFSQSQNTLSSHLTMLTSNYLFQHGVYSNFVDKPLPAHALTRRLGDLDWDCGAFTGVDFLAHLLGNKVGGPDPRFPAASERGLVARFTRRLYGRRISAAKTLERGLHWLKASRRSKDAFLWLHLFDAHMAYEAPKTYIEAHVTGGTATRPLSEELMERGWFAPDFPEYHALLPLEHFPQRYRAAVAYQDASLGVFFDALKTIGYWDDALVVVTADHGECLLGDHSVYCAHKKLFDTTVHVPLRVKFPKGLHAGLVVGELVQHVDLAPTVAAFAGFEEPLYMGKNLDAIASGRESGHPFAFSEHVENFMRAARDKEWIYTELVPGAENKWKMRMEEGRLFHRDSTPAEKGGETEAARLKDSMDILIASRPDVAEAWGGEEAADEATAARLHELGYF